MLQNVFIKKLAEHSQLQKQQSQFQRSDQIILTHDSAIIKFNDFSEKTTLDLQFNALMHNLVADINSLSLEYYRDAL